MQGECKADQEIIPNLMLIAEELQKKIRGLEDIEYALSSKLSFHENDEKKIVEELFYYKSLAEEAVLSFQKFNMKLVGLINQNTVLIISRFDDKPYVSLQIGKQQLFLAHETNCTICMHPKKTNRFYIALDDKTREFESEEAEKITRIISTAIHKTLEI